MRPGWGVAALSRARTTVSGVREVRRARERCAERPLAWAPCRVMMRRLPPRLDVIVARGSSLLEMTAHRAD